MSTEGASFRVCKHTGCIHATVGFSVLTQGPSEGLKLYRGGEELRRATAALAGTLNPRSPQAAVGGAGAAPQSASLPRLTSSQETADVSSQDLVATAQRYALAMAAEPTSFDAVFSHALASQELATRAAGQPAEALRLLTEACASYGIAHSLRPASHAALYNWGVALSDMAHQVDGTSPGVAYDHLLASAEKYGLSLKWNPKNPQALNNWGLVLQELAGLRPAEERATWVGAAVTKFRRAIRQRPDFDRACYNLGTVYYAHAGALQGADAADSEVESRGTDSESSNAVMHEAFALAAQYIALAYAMQPNKEVYKKSLQVVNQLLPLPFLRTGFLQAVDPDRPGAIDERWSTCWFVLDHTSLRTAPLQQRGGPGLAPPYDLTIPLSDIDGAHRVSDLSLPAGSALWLPLHSRPYGVYLVSSTATEAEGWVDALQLLGHLAANSRLGSLNQALTTAAHYSQPPVSAEQRYA